MSKGKHRQEAPTIRQELVYLKRTVQNRWYAFLKPAIRKMIKRIGTK